VQTLDTTLKATKDDIARGFVDGFSVALEQFRTLYPALDQSEFDPFKIGVDGKIVEENNFILKNSSILTNSNTAL